MDPATFVLYLRHKLAHDRWPYGLFWTARQELGPKNQFYEELVRRSNAKGVVETGVRYGYSSAYLLRGLQRTGGRLWSIDLPTVDPAGRINDDRRRDGAHVRTVDETGCVVSPGLRRRWTLCLGDATELLPALLGRLRPLDMVVLDDDHSSAHVAWELDLAFEALRPGGLLVCDDTDWSHAWIDFVRRHQLEGRPFPTDGARQFVTKNGRG